MADPRKRIDARCGIGRGPIGRRGIVGVRGRLLVGSRNIGDGGHGIKRIRREAARSGKITGLGNELVVAKAGITHRRAGRGCDGRCVERGVAGRRKGRARHIPLLVQVVCACPFPGSGSTGGQ